MSKLPDVNTVAYQKSASTFPAEVKSTELLELASDQHEEDHIELVTSDSEINSDEETTTDEGIFVDVLAKIRALKGRSFEVNSKKTIFNDAYPIFVELLNLIDEHKDDTNYNLSATTGLKLLLKSIRTSDPNELFEKDPIYALETLYLYLSLLSLSGIRNYLTYGEINADRKQLYEKYILSPFILQVLSSAMAATNISIHDSEQLSNYNESLLLMLNYVKGEIYRWTSPKYSSTTVSILLFIRGYAEKTVLIPNLIKGGCVEVVLKCLANINQYRDQQANVLPVRRNERTVLSHLINILYNISWHLDGRTSLNSTEAVDLMKQIQTNDGFEDEDYSEKIILIRMAVALCTTPEQIKNDRKNMNSVLDHLLQSMYTARQSEDHCHNGLHISDLLIFLKILMTYERTLDYLLDHTEANFDNKTQSTIQFLIESFLKFHQDVSNEDPFKRMAMTAFCNILWNISLRHPYKHELRKNEDLKTLIKKIVEAEEKVPSPHYLPKCIDTIQKAAEGILFNITESSITGLRALFLVIRPNSINSSSRSGYSKFTGPNLMISYADGDNDICTQLYNELAKRNIQFDVCIDWKYCNIDFPWEHVDRSMDNPNVILCLLSQKYYESNLCQRELVKRFHRANVIPVCIDHTKIPGWLCREIRKLNRKTIQFDKRHPLDSQKFEELLDIINEYLLSNSKKSPKNPKKEPRSVSSAPTEMPTAQTVANNGLKRDNPDINSSRTGMSESADIQTEESLQVAPDASEGEDSEAKDVDASDSSTTSSEEIPSDEEVSDENTDEGVFSDVMTKIYDFKKTLSRQDSQKSKEDIQQCEEDLKRSMLYDVYSILTEFINLIEEHEDEIDSLRIVKKGLELLTQSVDYAYGNELLKDPGYALETSYLYLNLLKLSGFKKYLTHKLMNDNIKRLYEKYIVALSVDLLVVSISKSHFTIKDLVQMDEHNDSLILLLTYVQAEVDSWTDVNWKPKYSRTTGLILHIFWNYSDKTVVIPNLIKVNCVEVILKCLTKVLEYRTRKPMSVRAKKHKKLAAESLINIVYNISRHDEGIIVLNSLQVANLIKQWQSEECFHDTSDLIMVCRMTLALLSTPNEIKNDRKRINYALDELLEYVVAASKTSDYCYHGLHISESLIVLVKLINYDRTLDYILQHTQADLGDENKSTIQFFVKLFLKFHKEVPDAHPFKQTTDTAFLNILWSISLRQQYKRKLQEIPEFAKVIKEIANEKASDTSLHYIPKYIENIQKAADGIICNIIDNPTESEKPQHRGFSGLKALVLKVRSASADNNVSKGNSSKPSKPSIMISYSHADNDVCTQLYKELDKRNEDFDIWIDWKHCNTGNLWEKIADGIVNASVVLCLLSQKYYESKSCQQEFFYVFNKLKKNVIPIYIERTKPPNHMELLMCMTKYVRFLQTQPLNPKTLGQLMTMINEFLSLNDASSKNPTKEIMSSPPVHHETPTTVVEENHERISHSMSSASTITSIIPTIDLFQKPIDQWNKTDITIWFQQNKILPEICALYDFEDGNELLMYFSSVSTDEKSKYEYQICSQAYSQVNNGKILMTHKFARFVNALKRLYDKNENVHSED